MSAISRRSLSKGELEAQRNLMSHDRGLAELKENAVDAEAEEAEEEKETGFYEMLLEKPVEMKNQDESLPTVTPGPVTARILVGFAEEASQVSRLPKQWQSREVNRHSTMHTRTDMS